MYFKMTSLFVDNLNVYVSGTRKFYSEPDWNEEG